VRTGRTRRSLRPPCYLRHDVQILRVALSPLVLRHDQRSLRSPGTCLCSLSGLRAAYGRCLNIQCFWLRRGHITRCMARRTRFCHNSKRREWCRRHGRVLPHTATPRRASRSAAGRQVNAYEVLKAQTASAPHNSAAAPDKTLGSAPGAEAPRSLPRCMASRPLAVRCSPRVHGTAEQAARRGRRVAPECVLQVNRYSVGRTSISVASRFPRPPLVHNVSST
jgi:hypothetical protein